MIKSRITLKQLEAFAFVVDTGSFRAAAEALGTTQPNISARISALEKTLSTVLLLRDAGSVQITPKGAELLQKTREVLWSAEGLLREAGRQELIEERLRLGVTELVACTWLNLLLRDIKAEFPNVRVELDVDLSDRIERGLEENRLDLAIHNAAYTGRARGYKALGEAAYVWVAKPEIAQRLGPNPQISTLFDFPVMTHARNTSAAASLHKLAKENSLPTGQIVHSSALSACVPMVTEGMGVALLPKALLRAELNSGTLQQVNCDWLPAPLTFHARYTPSRAALFVERAAELAVNASASIE